jgi:membrane-bound lytic murein transglycosylase F
VEAIMRLCLGTQVLAVAVLAGTSLAGADLPALRQRGALRVLAVDGSPRFFGLREDVPLGLDREILAGFARVEKLELAVVPVSTWDALIPTLAEGGGDVAAGGVTATEARRKIVDFTGEVFPSRQVAITRRPHRLVQTLDELRAERVGTIKGTAMADVIREARVPAANIDDGYASGRLPEALKSGRVTAIVLGIEDAIVAQQVDPELQLGVFLGSKQSLAFAVPKDAPALRRALDDYIANLRHTPTWDRLVVKYFGKAALEILQKAQSQ